MLNIIHEVNQLEFGGVEEIIKCIAKYDDKNNHHVISYKDGDFRPILEQYAKVSIVKDGDDITFPCDLIHVHTGGASSNLVDISNGKLPIIETMHSPLRSIISPDRIQQRIGVTDAVSNLNTKCKTIYDGIDMDVLKTKKSRNEIREEIGIPEDAFVIGRLGRLAPDKSVEDFLIVINKLQQLNDIDCHVLIVGDGEKGFVGKMKLIVESLPVNNVHFVGYQQDKSDYYQAMDLFLYPSRLEGFGLVFIEALLHGLPVITYDTEVNREILKNYAMFAPKDDIDILYSQSLAFITLFAEKFKKNLVHIGHLKIKFGVKKMVTQYQELYEHVYEHFNR